MRFIFRKYLQGELIFEELFVKRILNYNQQDICKIRMVRKHLLSILVDKIFLFSDKGMYE